MMEKIVVQVCQINSRPADINANVDLHMHEVDLAVKDKQSLIIFPELSLTGYNIQDAAFDLALSPTDSVWAPFIDRSKDISIIVGAPERALNGAIFNSAFLIEDGHVQVAHRKRYLPTYNVFDESRFFTGGNHIQPIETKVGKVGLLICEDSWHPGLSYLLAYSGIDLLVIIAASPFRTLSGKGTVSIDQKWSIICQAYASIYSLPVVFCNRVGSEDGIIFWGGSRLIKAGGTILEKAPEFETARITGVFHKSATRLERYTSTHFLDEDLLWQAEQLTRITRLK